MELQSMKLLFVTKETKKLLILMSMSMIIFAILFHSTLGFGTITFQILNYKIQGVNKMASSQSNVRTIRKLFDTEKKTEQSEKQKVSKNGPKKSGKVHSMAKLFNAVLGTKKSEPNLTKKVSKDKPRIPIKVISPRQSSSSSCRNVPVSKETFVAKPKPAWVVGDRAVHISKDIENKWDNVNNQLKTMLQCRAPGNQKDIETKE